MRIQKTIMGTSLATALSLAITVPAFAASASAPVNQPTLQAELAKVQGSAFTQQSTLAQPAFVRKAAHKSNAYQITVNGKGVVVIQGTAGATVTTNIPGQSSTVLSSTGWKGIPVSVSTSTTYYFSGDITNVYFVSEVNGYKVKSGKIYAVANSSLKQNTFTYKATQNGYIIAEAAGFDAQSYSSFKISLASGSRKLSTTNTISPSSSIQPGVYYGVKKGKTYKIHVKPTTLYPTSSYAFGLKLYPVSDKSGASQAKARKIKKGKTYTGIIQAGSSKSDWYKIKPNKKTIYVNFRFASNDKLKVTLIGKYKGKVKDKESRTMYLNGTRKIKLYTYGSHYKVSDITWYVKVSRANSKSSGAYKIKW